VFLAPAYFSLKLFVCRSDGVGMSNTNRHITHRRHPVPARRALPAMTVLAPGAAPSSRVEALRRLVAAGQYRVDAKHLAMRIFRAAGVPLPE
jgi:hypothetical protein